MMRRREELTNRIKKYRLEIDGIEKKQCVQKSELENCLENKYERLSKDHHELKLKYGKLKDKLKKKEVEIRERERKLQMEKEALGLIKGEIQDGLPIEKLSRKEQEIVPFQNIQLKKSPRRELLQMDESIFEEI